MELLELRMLARTVDDPALTYRQRMHRLAVLAENSLEPPPVSAACAAALDKRIVCDMYEGNAPHRPRYVLPDYATLLRGRVGVPRARPAGDLEEALTHLLIAYTQVPSITGTRSGSATIRHLHAAGRLAEVRLLLVPGFNVSDDQLACTAAWLADLDPDCGSW